MGRTRKRFNEKARQSSNTGICQDEKEKIVVDISIEADKYDASNPLVICSKKKEKQKKSQKEVPVPKQLSRKQKKRLQNILAKKKKKINRAELLEKLSKVQCKPHESDLLASTASVQTHGLKRLMEENTNYPNRTCLKISNIKGSRKKSNLPPQKKIKLMPNVNDFESSLSDCEEESEDENESIDDMNCSKVDDDVEDEIENKDMNCSKVDDVEDEIENKDMNCSKVDDVEDQNENTDDMNCTKGDDVYVEDKNESGINCIKEQTVADIIQHVPAVFVPLNRLPEVQAMRQELPIFGIEDTIMEAIQKYPVVVIHGKTGSGKTTQVPQFLYEGGYTLNNKMIGITEPRRIAAMTMAARVGKEMNLPDIVAYHVRYENNVKEETEIKFMTDGVLLKEIRRDFYLTKYSVIIIDEAHERAVFSDVLIGLLSRIVPIRAEKGNPLKLIIMSATIRVQDFTENPNLFKEPPFVIAIDTRQYPVQVHYNIQTPSDYLEAAYHKVCKIHSQLPSGAILVFVTGEKEVTRLCKMLQNTFPFKDNPDLECENLKTESTYSVKKFSKRKNKKKKSNDTSFCSLPAKINLDDYSVEPLDTENLQHELSEEDTVSESLPIKKQEGIIPLYTLPLYSVLPFEEQEKVFQPPPAGTRLCVVSTNVAETSITIPGLKYVVDSGKVKTKVFDNFSGGVSQFVITWSSKASANQRAGRAGRTMGGHCYRLYSSSVFENDFPEFSSPEVQRIPVDDVLLQMKALGIDRVVNFPFPSPPDHEALKAAERRLVLLGALQDLNKCERYKDVKKWEYSAKVTRLGKAMSRFPLSPRYAKMLILSYKHLCVPYVIALVSAMTVPEVFLKSSTGSDDNEQNSEEKIVCEGIKKINIGRGKALQLGDAMVLLKTVALYEESKNKVKFCLKNSIRHKAMVEIHKMCLQLRREMNHAFEDLSLPLELNIPPPNEEQLETLRKILTTGFTDHVARLLPAEEMKLNKELKNAYKCLDLENPVYIHPSSILFTELPRYVIYQEIVYTSKYYMKGVSEIDPEWLAAFAPTLCTFSDPLEEPAPSYNLERDQILCTMNVTFGLWQWELPPVIMEMPKSLLKYSWFAFFLLDGQIHTFFKNYRPHLLSSPFTVLKSWARLLPRIRYLLQALAEKEVDSRESLIRTWEKEPKYLLREYWEWLPNQKHMEIECKWPPQ